MKTHRITAGLLLALTLQSSVWAQTPGGPIPGGPTPGDTRPTAPQQQGGNRPSFGISLDLSAILRAVQNSAPQKYESPDVSNRSQYEEAQLVVAWEQATSDPRTEQLQAGGASIIALSLLSNLGITVAVLQFPSQAQATAALPALRAINPNIVADQHAIGYPMQTGGASARQYALSLLNVQRPEQAQLAAPVAMGVIDTEVANAQALNAVSYKAKRIFPDSDKGAPTDHGSGVAAILAARSNEQFQGLSQGAHLRVAGVMREIVPGIVATNTALIAEALDWLLSENVQVANLSLGAAHDAVLALAVSKAQAKGMVLVAAAGNGGASAAPSFPAAYPGVIAVTAVDASKQLYTRANRGNYIALAAPGVDVWLPVGNGKYMSGTSFAAPFVTAAIAHVIAQRGAQRSSLASADIVKALCSKAQPLSATVPSPEFGCGLLQP